MTRNEPFRPISSPFTDGLVNYQFDFRPEPAPTTAVKRMVDLLTLGIGDDTIDAQERDMEWYEWLAAYFPAIADKPFADHHVEFWEWIWSIEEGVRPRPFVAIWSRGGGKSSSAEMASVAIGARGVRKYIWYVGETQESADKHVETIGEMLEGVIIEKRRPSLAQRDVSKYGHSKGWRRSRLRTASGLTIDAIGLDTARRGAKVRENRPDVMIFDDIDAKHDTARTTDKKIEIITTSLLPAGSNDLAVMMVQNLIHPDSIFSRLANKTAGFLFDAHISGPHPAVTGLAYEEKPDGGYTIIGGEPTWDGQDLVTCEAQINEWGLTAFLQEAQHEVQAKLGGIWDHIVFRQVRREDVPDLLAGGVWVDPAVTSTDKSDSHAISASGIDSKGTIYRLFSWEQVTSPNDSIWRAILKAFELGFNVVGIETDQGGDTWKSVYREVWREMNEAAAAVLAFDDARERKDGADATERDVEDFKTARAVLAALDEVKVGRIRPYAAQLVRGDLLMPKFRQAKAGAGHGSKVERNTRMLADYERGRVVHVVGTHHVLEQSLKRFPLTPPHDLTDAAFWDWADLRGVSKGVFF